MLGLGGMIGGVAGGLIIQYYSSYFIFYIFGMVGFCIAMSGFMMDSAIEQEHMTVINMSLGQRVRQNCSDIKLGFKVKELWKSFLFYFLFGCMVPSFGDFFYYY